MIIKEEIDVRRFAKEVEGVFEDENVEISYCLNLPAWLALTGQKQELEEILGQEGMTPAGISPEIFRCLEKPMYMNLSLKETVDGGIRNSFRIAELDDWRGQEYFFTAAEAAVMGGQEEIFQMLIRHGALFDLRVMRTRNIFFRCRSESLIRRILSGEYSHFSETDFLMTDDGFGWNLWFLRVLAERLEDRPEFWILQWKCFLSREGKNRQNQRAAARTDLGVFIEQQCRKACESGEGRIRNGLLEDIFFSE